MIALASKTYYLAKTDGTEGVKAKGVQRRAIENPRRFYEDALFRRVSGKVTNVGFRVRDNTIMTYSQRKRGFGFFYVKRLVQDNHIDTVPLSIELNPWEDHNTFVLKKRVHRLSNDYRCPLVKYNVSFTSCAHLFLYEMARANNCRLLMITIANNKQAKDFYRAGSKVVVNECWFAIREKVMEEVVQLKIDMMKHEILEELREVGGRMIVQPGHSWNSYFTCALSEGMAEISSPESFPGHDYMSLFWHRKMRDVGFMTE